MNRYKVEFCRRRKECCSWEMEEDRLWTSGKRLGKQYDF